MQPTAEHATVTDSSKGRVYFIGAGPGDPDLITVRGRRIIRRAQLVLYAGSLVPEAIVAEASPGAQVVDSAPMNLDQTHALMLEAVNAGHDVARVHTGDPGLYGAVREQAALLENDGVEYEIVPGVTAAFAAAARARVSLTVPDRCQTVILTRDAGNTPVPEGQSLRSLAAHGAAMAVYLSAADPESMTAELKEGGLPGDTPVVVAHRVGWVGERVERTTLDQAAPMVRADNLTRQTLFLIMPSEDGEDHRSNLYDAAYSHGFRKGGGE